MAERGELGEFLRSMRARLRPQDAGLADRGARRRGPGLRREEVAHLAGVSAGYYTRLEQGQSPNPSDAVLDAVARVLRLDDAERAHLYALARPRADVQSARGPEEVRPVVRAMIESLGRVPALVMGRSLDVLAWNATAHALVAGHLDIGVPDRPSDRPNVARMVFLDPDVRALYGDWAAKARSTLADLRMIRGFHPHDPDLGGLLAELTVRSPEFADLWTAHHVGDCGPVAHIYRHPVVGPMALDVELLALPGDDGQRVAVFTAEAGSSSEVALRHLAHLALSGAGWGRG